METTEWFARRAPASARQTSYASGWGLRGAGVGLALAVVAALGGCVSPSIIDPARTGPFFEPNNVAAQPTLGGIRRVVLMPVWAGGAANDDSAAELDPIFRQALQDQNRFEVVVLPRRECNQRFGAAALCSASALPHDLMPTLQRLYAADAVLFVDITVYRAYNPLALGIRARLARSDTLGQVWMADNVFAADDPIVAAAARQFYLESEKQRVPGDLTPVVLQSPSRFAAYAASATFGTLPAVAGVRLTESSLHRR